MCNQVSALPIDTTGIAKEKRRWVDKQEYVIDRHKDKTVYDLLVLMVQKQTESSQEVDDQETRLRERHIGEREGKVDMKVQLDSSTARQLVGQLEIIIL